MQCSECPRQFDPNSTAKKHAGGLVDQCPACATEHTQKYKGRTYGEGKMVAMDVVRADGTLVTRFSGNPNHKGREV